MFQDFWQSLSVINYWHNFIQSMDIYDLLMIGIVSIIFLFILRRAQIVANFLKKNICTLEETKHALEESNRLNNAILASAAHIMIAIDKNGYIIVFNREAERALQYREADLKYKFTQHLWHDPQEMVRRAKDLSIELGRSIQPGIEVFTAKPLLYGSEESEWNFIRSDSTYFPGHMVVTVLRDASGEVAGFLGVIQDITEQRRQKAALAASEETFRIALESAPIGMALVSLDGHWLRVNTALCNFLGYNVQEFSNMNFQAITFPADLDQNLEYIRQMINGERQTYEIENRYFHKDGRIIWAQLIFSCPPG